MTHEAVTPGLKRYDDYAGIQRIGRMWALSQGPRVLHCTLTTHPLGWELRLTIGDSMSRTQVCKIEPDVFEAAAAWRAEAEQKGWTP
jgi:hypothetical protein